MAAVWQYRVFHLNPAVDLDAAIDAYAGEGWQLWEAGRGSEIMLNGAPVHVLWLRRLRDVAATGAGTERPEHREP